MKRLIARALLLSLFVVPMVAPALAQVPDPAATPILDRQVYDDAGMHLVIPDTFRAVVRRQVTLDELGNDPILAGVWVAKSGDPRQISLYFQGFQEMGDAWSTAFENEMRSQYGDLIVRSTQKTSLKNGMPAWFFDMTYGSGFNTTKEYALVWADGQRGGMLTIVGHVGQVSAEEAKRDFANLTAVVYPTGR